MLHGSREAVTVIGPLKLIPLSQIKTVIITGIKKLTELSVELIEEYKQIHDTHH